MAVSHKSHHVTTHYSAPEINAHVLTVLCQFAHELAQGIVAAIAEAAVRPMEENSREFPRLPSW